MFNLANFEKEIREMARANDKAPAEALEMFVLNLAVMQPRFDKGVEKVNFRSEGQKWNALTSTQRNTQKKALLDIFEKSNRARPAARE